MVRGVGGGDVDGVGGGVGDNVVVGDDEDCDASGVGLVVDTMSDFAKLDLPSDGQNER